MRKVVTPIVIDYSLVQKILSGSKSHHIVPVDWDIQTNDRITFICERFGCPGRFATMTIASVQELEFCQYASVDRKALDINVLSKLARNEGFDEKIGDYNFIGFLAKFKKPLVKYKLLHFNNFKY